MRLDTTGRISNSKVAAVLMLAAWAAILYVGWEVAIHLIPVSTVSGPMFPGELLDQFAPDSTTAPITTVGY